MFFRSPGDGGAELKSAPSAATSGVRSEVTGSDPGNTRRTVFLERREELREANLL